jgi:methylated-DNA-protein-cysteine methyltransferase related protein
MPRVRNLMPDLFLPPARSRAAHRAPAAENTRIQAIWDVVCAIPHGQVTTYGAVARAAGLPGRARMAGYALRVAPDNMNIPWHRVLGAGGKIVFATTSSHHREQAKRLRAEGVAVKQGRVDKSVMTDLEDN